ncbi:MAG TPA: DUF3857 domain-containing protein [Flavobacteriaceae bacterium]|nr:DUF3857 domain-containing protein [Flavobacteriaceae bacterium]
MFRKLIFLGCFILWYGNGLSQTQSLAHVFGKPLQKEFDLSMYPLDPDAAGVVLFERGFYTVDMVNNTMVLLKNIHRKIKVLDPDRFGDATVEIQFLSWRGKGEEVRNLKAVTHNGAEQHDVSQDAFYRTEKNSLETIIAFTFPDIQKGSILEYSYQLTSPYYSVLGDWTFMNDYPTIYSELHLEIPANFRYNRTLFGNKNLDVNQSAVRKNCLRVEGYIMNGDCEVATYAMTNIPARTYEKFISAHKNYEPSISFEMVQTIDFRKKKRVYTQTWKDVERQVMESTGVGANLSFASYFKRKLPAAVLSIPDPIERAKAVYYEIQKHFQWNGSSRLNWLDVKEAYATGKATSSEINLTLINALQAANISARPMLLPTRNAGMATKQYPVLSEFNYLIAFVRIENETYLLDATDKISPFGLLPFRALNNEGRVFDISQSYWYPIKPFDKSLYYAKINIEALPENVFSGEIEEVSTGYIAQEARGRMTDRNHKELQEAKQRRNERVEITDYTIAHKTELEQPLKEHFGFEFRFEEDATGKIFLYPFITETYFQNNPFLNEKREYPIDFGYPMMNTYLITIDLKNQYEIIKTPENKQVQLPYNDGSLAVVYEQKDNVLFIRLNIRLNNHQFPAEAYPSLREFFREMISIQSHEPIELKPL